MSVSYMRKRSVGSGGSLVFLKNFDFVYFLLYSFVPALSGFAVRGWDGLE